MKQTRGRLIACIAASIVVQLLLLAWLARPVSLPLSLPTLEVLLVSPRDLDNLSAASLPAQTQATQAPTPSQSGDAQSKPPPAPLSDPLAAKSDRQPVPNIPQSGTGITASSIASVLPIDFTQSLSPPQPAGQNPANSVDFRNPDPHNAGVELAIRQRLAQFQSYPPSARRRGIEGDVTVRFVIGQRGKVMDSELIKSSGSRHLDQAALRLVADAAPYPSLPASISASRLEVKIPIEYRLQPPAI